MSRWKDSRHRHGARPSRSKRVPRDRLFHSSRHFEVLEERTLLSVYYVAVNGNDANAGDIGAPFKTFEKAITTVVAGDTIYVRGAGRTPKIMQPYTPSNGATTSDTTHESESVE